MLFFKRGRVPGARSWELKTGLGKEYPKVLAQLDEALKDLDLEVKKVESQTLSDFKPGPDGEEEMRYFVRLKGTLTPKEARMTGWRIDNLAALAACMSLIVSKQGKSERKELEQIIGEKVGRWRALTLTDAFLRSGYLEEDEEGLMKIGWRTRAELDLASLMMLIAESKPKGAIVEEEPGEGGLTRRHAGSTRPQVRDADLEVDVRGIDVGQALDREVVRAQLAGEEGARPARGADHESPPARGSLARRHAPVGPRRCARAGGLPGGQSRRFGRWRPRFPR